MNAQTKVKKDDGAVAPRATAAEPEVSALRDGIAIADNAFSRLAAAREQIHSGGLNKTGSAPNRRGNYFELSDFIVPAQRALRDNGLVGVMSYANNQATLEIVNLDEPTDKIVIASPLGSARLPNCHEVQNIGAVQTYQRRYLWMTALEIVEHDALEGSEVANDDKAEAPLPKRENHGGRYPTKTALKQAMHTHNAELQRLGNEGCLDDLEGYLTSPEYKDYIAAAQDRAMPYLTGEGDTVPPEYVGTFELEQKAKDLIALRGNRAAEMENA